MYALLLALAAIMPQGFYALQPGNPGRALKPAVVQKPVVAGMTIRFPMLLVAKTPDKWDWSYVDAQVKKMEQAKKPFKLLPMSGDGTPTWIKGQWLNGAPLPWSPENRAFVKRFYKEMGKRYGKNPWLAGVHIIGGTRKGTSEELHPDPKWNNDKGMIEAYSGFIDNAVESFPDSPTYWLAISVQGRAKNYVPKIVEYGLKVAKGKFGVKHNALKAVEIGAEHNLAVVRYVKQGALMGFEMVGGTAEDKPGSPGVPRTGTRKIMDSINQGYRLADQAGYPRSKLVIDVYPPDLDSLRLP